MVPARRDGSCLASHLLDLPEVKLYLMGEELGDSERMAGAEWLFESQRLAARRLVADDASAMLAIYGDRESMRYVGDSEPLDEASCLHWVEVTDRNFELRGYGMVALESRATGELVGCIGIVHPDQQELPEVKYAFRRDQWGMGLASEAVAAIVAYAWDSLGLMLLTATVAPEHLASQRNLAKAGFHQAGLISNDDGTETQLWEISRCDSLARLA